MQWRLLLALFIMAVSRQTVAAPIQHEHIVPRTSNSVLGSPVVTLSYQVPETWEGCTISQTEWSVWTQYATLFSPAMAEYIPVNELGSAVTKTIQPSLLVLQVDTTLLLKYKNWIYVDILQAKGISTYNCPDTQSKPPAQPKPKKKEKTCTEEEKKSWCRDVDGDGVFSYDAWDCEKPAGSQWASCNGPGDCDDNDPAVGGRTDYWVDEDSDNYWIKTSLCPHALDKYKNKIKVISGPIKQGFLVDCDDENSDITHSEVCTDTDGDGYVAEPCGCKFFGPLPKGQIIIKSNKSLQWDCNDKDSSLTKKTDFVWDGDGDGYPLKGSGTQKCAHKLFNNTGTWLTKEDAATKQKTTIGGLQYEEGICDTDPTGYNATYYVDSDGDGVPTDVTKKSFSCAAAAKKEHFVPAPAAGKPWDECDDYPKLKKKSTYYRDQDNDGLPNPEQTEKFCTVGGAKQAGYLPKQYEEKAVATTVPNAATAGPSAVPTPSPASPLSPTATLNPVVSPDIERWDCDDTDPEMADLFTVFHDGDNDGFGDIRRSKSLRCTGANGPAVYKAYQAGEKNGWALAPDDMNALVPATSMLNNLQTSGRVDFWLMKDDNLQLCAFFGGESVHCFRAPFLSAATQICPTLLAETGVPIIAGKDLVDISVLDAPADVERGFFFAHCIERKIKKSYAVALTAPTATLIATNFHPMGRHLFPANGTLLPQLKFAVTVPPSVTLPQVTVSDATIAYLLPFMTTDLGQVTGPVPVRAAGGGPYKRKILAGGKLGPTFDAVPVAADVPIPDLLREPWIQMKGDLPPAQDRDKDFLFDELERPLGLIATNGDGDGDGAGDTLEYLLDGRRPYAALAPAITPSFTAGGNILVPTLPVPSDLALMKEEAQKLAPVTLERLMELYGDDERVEINPDVALMTLLIATAEPTTIWLDVPPSLATAPFAARARRGLGLSIGCGPDQQFVCIDMLQHAADNEPFYEYVNTLLHESLHRVMKMRIADLELTIEHEIIEDVLGGGDLGYCLEGE